MFTIVLLGIGLIVIYMMYDNISSFSSWDIEDSMMGMFLILLFLLLGMILDNNLSELDKCQEKSGTYINGKCYELKEIK